MARKRYNAEEIIHRLREADVLLGQGETVGQVCKQLGVVEQTYYRWRKAYGGMKIDQAKRLRRPLRSARARHCSTGRIADYRGQAASTTYHPTGGFWRSRKVVLKERRRGSSSCRTGSRNSGASCRRENDRQRPTSAGADGARGVMVPLTRAPASAVRNPRSPRRAHAGDPAAIARRLWHGP